MWKVTSRVGITFGLKSNRTHYEAALRGVGLEPVAISPAEPKTALDGLEGLVLSGGADVKEQPERDELEGALLALALAADLPVLGICRGLQFMNWYAGGALHRDIPGHSGPEGAKTIRHRIRVARGSRLASLLGEELEVNSRHHQAIEKLADSYVLSAVSADGVKEAIERPDRRWTLAVQWHPEEMQEDPRQKRLFQAFADAVDGGNRLSR